jgi:hypothetical protein
MFYNDRPGKCNETSGIDWTICDFIFESILRRYFWIPHWKHPVSGLIAKHNRRLTTTHRFAIGNLLATLFYGWLWLIDRLITHAYENDGS